MILREVINKIQTTESSTEKTKNNPNILHPQSCKEKEKSRVYRLKKAEEANQPITRDEMLLSS